MKIEFNTVTWYSKLAAVIFLLIVVPILTFYIGTQYEQVVMISNQPPLVMPAISPRKIDTTTLPDAFTVSSPESTVSNVVGYFAYGAFRMYVPDWVVDKWTSHNIPGNLGIVFSPKQDVPDSDFSDISIVVATSTEDLNAATLYSEQIQNKPLTICIVYTRCENPEASSTVLTSEVLLSQIGDTRIYHVSQMIPGGKIADSFFMDGNDLTAMITFSAGTDTYSAVSAKVREFVQGIGAATSPQD